MKRTIRMITVVLVLLLALSFPVFGTGTSEQPGATKIGVSKLLAHPALDAVEVGMQDYLATTGLTVTYDFQNANGDISTTSSISQKFKSDKVNIVVGIATPTAQSLANVFSDIPVVFTAVTDPVSAGLVDTYSGSSATNVCGVSDQTPVEEHISLLVQLTGAKTIGMIYASGEANGVVLMEMTKNACEKLGVGFVSSAVSNTSEVRMATQSIIDRVDAIYVATDNTVISAVASVDDVCAKAGKPIFLGDPSSMADLTSCIAASGFDYYSIGVATGRVVERILKGEHSGSIGTVFLNEPNDLENWFNLDTAAKFNISIPQTLIDSAAVIFKDGKQINQR